jgi:hypothetical protein
MISSFIHQDRNVICISIDDSSMRSILFISDGVASFNVLHEPKYEIGGVDEL